MAKTIVTYLVDGSPSGIKTVELSNWVWKWILIPRAKLKEAKLREETKKPSLYFLFWKNQTQTPTCYIWEAENLISRITTHDTKKDFWELVIAFISKDDNLTKADVRYLEHQAYNKAKQSSRYLLDNSNVPTWANLPEHQISTMDEFLGNIDLLISNLWFPVLREVELKEKNQKMYYCKWPSAIAQWYYSDEGFIVLKWSLTRKEIAKGSIWTWIENLQKNVFAKGILKEKDKESFVFIDDFLFDSASAAAWMILWRSANWWTEWKDKEGKTLNENERMKLE